MKWSEVKVTQSCPTLCDTMDCTVSPWNYPGQDIGVAFPFSRGSSQTRDWTQVSHIAVGFFTSWAIREVQGFLIGLISTLVFPKE